MQSLHCVDSHRTVARSRLEFSAVGHVVFRDPHGGEKQLRKETGTFPSDRTYLYADSDSDHMGCVCNYRYRTTCGISRKYVRDAQHGGFGGNAAACALSERILGVINCLYCVYNAFSDEIVSQIQGQMVYGCDFAVGFLVVGA